MGHIGVAEHAGAAIGADILRIVRNQAVALAGDAVLHLARRGEFKAFLHTALGLELGHFRLLAVRRYRPALAALVARQILHSIVRRRAPSGIRTKRQAGPGYRRSEERRVGKEGVGTCSSRWAATH